MVSIQTPPSPPPGVVANSESRVAPLLSVFVVVTTLILIVAPLRIYSRWQVGRLWRLEEYLMMISTILSLGLSVSKFVEIKNGAGRHIWDVPPADYVEGLKCNYISQVFTVPSLGVIKISISVFLARLPASKHYKRTFYGIGIFVGAWALPWTIMLMLQCVPISDSWNRHVSQHRGVGSCISPHDRTVLFYAYSTMNITTDVLLVFLPLTVLHKLNISKRQRVVSCAIIALGGVSAAAGAVKMFYIPSYGENVDWLWHSVKLSITTMIEINVAIVSASIPALRPLFGKYFGGSRGTRADEEGGQVGGEQRELDRVKEGRQKDTVGLMLGSEWTTTARNSDGIDKPVAAAEGMAKDVNTREVMVSSLDGVEPPFPASED